MTVPRLTLALLLVSSSAVIAQGPDRQAPERKTGGVLLSTSFQIESPLTVYQLSADRRTKLEYTEKHLLSIDPLSEQFSFDDVGEVTEGLHRIELTSPILSPDGKFVVGVTGAGLAVLDAASGAERTKHTDVGAGVCMAVHRAGEALLLGREDGRVQVRSLLKAEILFDFEAHEKPIRWIASARVDGRKPRQFMFTGSEDRTLRVWSVSLDEGKAEPGVTLKFDHTPRLVAFDDACERLITASTEEVQLWDLERGRLRKTVKSADEISCVALSPDGRSFAFGTVTGEVVFGDSKRGKALATWSAHPDHCVLAVHFIANDRRPVLITAGLGHDVCYWNAGRLPAEFGKGRKRRR